MMKVKDLPVGALLAVKTGITTCGMCEPECHYAAVDGTVIETRPRYAVSAADALLNLARALEWRWRIVHLEPGTRRVEVWR
jgi:hypothetical protein